jgi:iron complex transport system substrate-binding protein
MSAGRIVSLLASGTEIACALGLEDRLVGISHECDYPDTVLDRPRVSRPRFDPAGLDSGAIDRAVRRCMAEHGSVYEVDADLLAELEPDLILTQAVCEVCAVPAPGVEAVVAERGLAARVLSLDAHTIDQIFATIRAVAEAAGAMGHSAALLAGLRARIDAVVRAVRRRPRPDVLALEWLDPPFAPGHWVPEQIERAGGECVTGEAGGPSRETDWDTLAAFNADVLIVMPCGYGLDAARADADRFADRVAAVAPSAVVDHRAWVVDGSSYFNRSGPRVVDGIEILGAILHPDAVRRRLDGAAEVWTPAAAAERAR